MIYFLDKDPKKCAEMYSTNHLNVAILELEYIIMFTLLTKAIFIRTDINYNVSFSHIKRGTKEYLNDNREFLVRSKVHRSDTFTQEELLHMSSLRDCNGELRVYLFDILSPRLYKSVLELSDYIAAAFSNVYAKDPIIKAEADHIYKKYKGLTGRAEDVYLETLVWLVGASPTGISSVSSGSKPALCELIYAKDNILREQCGSEDSLPLVYWLICLMKELNLQRSIRLNTFKDHTSYTRVMDVLNRIAEYSSDIRVTNITELPKKTQANLLVKGLPMSEKRKLVCSYISSDRDGNYVDLKSLNYPFLCRAGAFSFFYTEGESSPEILIDDLHFRSLVCTLKFLFGLGSLIKNKEYKTKYRLLDPSSGYELTTLDFYVRDLLEEFGHSSVRVLDKCSSLHRINISRVSCEYVISTVDFSHRENAREMERNKGDTDCFAFYFKSNELVQPVSVRVLNSNEIVKNYRTRYQIKCA